MSWPSVRRAHRFPIRLHCLVDFGDCRRHGVSLNIGTSGLAIRIAENKDLDERTFIGSRVSVEFQLPSSSEKEHAVCEIVWASKEDQDIGGQPAVGLGLRISACADDVRSRLDGFIANFRYTVLIVCDASAPLVQGVTTTLRETYRLVTCASGAEAIEIVKAEEIAVVAVCEHVQEMSGSMLLCELEKRLPKCPGVQVVLVDACPTAVLCQVIHHAVSAYAAALENAHLSAELTLALQTIESENAFLRQSMTGAGHFPELVGKSEALARTLAELDRIRQTQVTVHIQGETGTGKELVARALHRGSQRAEGPFVALNCAGMSDPLLQSTLFGHRRGSFTGADRDQRGAFEEANGGTLFLDEVAELSAAAQGGLLRALQLGEIQPVGASRSIQVSVRVISATHKDLREEIKQGRFREDLFFRLVVMQVRLPSLRERIGDIPILAQHLLERANVAYGKNVLGFSVAAMQLLEAYAWPGNVRELENQIERLVVLSDDGSKIGPELLEPHIRGASPGATAMTTGSLYDALAWSALNQGEGLDEALGRLEQAMLAKASTACGGNQSAIARQLHLPRQTIQKRLLKHGL